MVGRMYRVESVDMRSVGRSSHIPESVQGRSVGRSVGRIEVPDRSKVGSVVIGACSRSVRRVGRSVNSVGRSGSSRNRFGRHPVGRSVGRCGRKSVGRDTVPDRSVVSVGRSASRSVGRSCAVHRTHAFQRAK